jgi:hypothetical protein
MPLFYFYVRDGDKVFADTQSIELTDLSGRLGACEPGRPRQYDQEVLVGQLENQ